MQQYEAAKRAGKTHKRWVSERRSTSRRSHTDAHGQVVPIDGYFTVGTERLFLPGDPSASFAETANCGCSVVFERRAPRRTGVSKPTKPQQPQADKPPLRDIRPQIIPASGSVGIPSVFSVDLDEHEYGRHNGHTLRYHVGLSNEELRKRLPKATAATVSTFEDQAQAEEAVNCCLTVNWERVHAWYYGRLHKITFMIGSNLPGGMRGRAITKRNPNIIKYFAGMLLEMTRSETHAEQIAIIRAFPVNDKRIKL